jgi:hypothetical protein
MSKKDETIKKEVSKLFSIKDKTKYTEAFVDLRAKYKDELDIADSIQKQFMDRHGSIYKYAQRMAEKIRKEYGHNVAYHKLVKRAKEYATKHNIEDYEFDEFQRMYEQELAGTTTHENIAPTTMLMNVLGVVSQSIEGTSELTESDYRTMQEILKEFELSKQLHAQTLLQALQYTDVAPQAIDAKIDRTKHNPANHIHPVIAAMFLPKIGVFESHFLFSNMGGIVSARYNQKPLTTRPDFELFHSLVTDPNDIVCDDKSPVTDLLNRTRIQHHLWNSVMHLRNGQVYNASFVEFTKMIDICRLNKYDNPDFVYGHHDGSVIKRLLSAFSFRPTVVATLPIINTFSVNPYSQNIKPTITTIPMINIKLHAYQRINRNVMTGVVPGGTNANRPPPLVPVALSGCLVQTQTFIEHHRLVQRITDVVYSREVLIFYVDRRAHLLQYGSPFNMTKLPSAIAGFERINTYPIEIECSISIRPQSAPNDDKFCLRSVVVADINQGPNPSSTDPRSIVVGSSAFIFDYMPLLDPQGNSTGIKSCTVPPLGGPGTRFFNNTNMVFPANGGPAVPQQNNCNNAIAIHHYDPMNALIKHSPYAIYDVINNIAGGGPPIVQPGLFQVGTAGTGIPVSGLSQQDAEKRIREQGIIFIYQNFAFDKMKEMSVAM